MDPHRTHEHRRSEGRGALAAGLAVVALFSSVPALAAPRQTPTAKDKADARALATDGRKALREKRWVDAIGALKKAERLDPGPALEVDLAQAQIGAGKLVEASKTLALAAASSDASAAGKKARDAAKKALADLGPRVPTLKLVVRGAPAEKVTATLDGSEVDASSDIPLNPGDHSVEASAPGFGSAAKDLHVDEGEHPRVALALAPRGDAGATSADASSTPSTSATSGSRVPGVIVTMVGGAGLVAGAIFGARAVSAANAAKAFCSNDVCPASVAGNVDQSKTDGNLATGLLVAGGAVTVAGIVLTVVAPGGAAVKSDDDGSSARVVPWIGPGLAGAGVRGRF
jgi:hypothetical protein